MAQEFRKFKIFLNALEVGLEVNIDGEDFVLGFDQENIPKISSKHFQETWVEGKMKREVIYVENLALQPINEFIKYITKHIDDDDEAILVSNIILNKKK